MSAIPPYYPLEQIYVTPTMIYTNDCDTSYLTKATIPVIPTLVLYQAHSILHTWLYATKTLSPTTTSLRFDLITSFVAISDEVSVSFVCTIYVGYTMLMDYIYTNTP